MGSKNFRGWFKVICSCSVVSKFKRFTENCKPSSTSPMISPINNRRCSGKEDPSKDRPKCKMDTPAMKTRASEEILATIASLIDYNRHTIQLPILKLIQELFRIFHTRGIHRMQKG